MENVTLRIGRGITAQAAHAARRPSRPLLATLGQIVDRFTAFAWTFLAVLIPLAPYLAHKPPTNFWWWIW
jgi:hypothetical protein